MAYVNKEIVLSLREKYPAGSRVRLLEMNDPYVFMPSGTLGTVQLVDDSGTVHVNWDDGHTLGVVYGEDYIEKV